MRLRPLLPRRRRRQSGFVLLDALAAFTVLAMGLGTILVGLAIAMRSDAREVATRGALRIAQSRLADAGTVYALAPGRIEGDDPGGEHWIVDISALGPAAPGDATAGPSAKPVPEIPRAFWVSVAVRTPEGAALRFAQLKLAAPGKRR